MFGNVLKFYYNGTVSIVQLCPQSIYILGHQLSGFQYHLFVANKHSGSPKEKRDTNLSTHVCLMFLIYRRLTSVTLKLTSGICKFMSFCLH